MGPARAMRVSRCATTCGTATASSVAWRERRGELRRFMAGSVGKARAAPCRRTSSTAGRFGRTLELHRVAFGVGEIHRGPLPFGPEALRHRARLHAVRAQVGADRL